jgi:hypothetical protein
VADALRGIGAEEDVEDRLRATTLLGTLAVLLVVGSFDAVLLLPVPALAAWALLGALSAPSRERQVVELPPITRVMAVLLLGAGLALAATRSATQLAAIAIFSTTTRTTQLERASRLDRGSYRIHVRLATGYVNRGSCVKARIHAARAHALFPNAPVPKRILRECGG